MLTPRQFLGIAIGVLAGATGAVLAAVFFVANGPITVHDVGWWIWIMPGLGIAGVVAVVAALRRAPRPLLGVFVVAFLPSLYLVLESGPFALFGAAEVGYFVAWKLVR